MQRNNVRFLPGTATTVFFLIVKLHLVFSVLQAGQSSVAVNQIELDLLRTLPTNKYYDKPNAQGVCVLFSGVFICSLFSFPMISAVLHSLCVITIYQHVY